MIPMLLDYPTLQLLWWALLGVLLIGLAVMDGFDMGVAFLNLFVAKTEAERRIVINTIGPVWEGNQVWLILAAGAIFAAFPVIYATAFSGFYIAMFAVLLCLILRPVSFEYRNKFDQSKRAYWDIALFTSGLVPPLVFGVAFGNLFQGVPFYFDDIRLVHYVPAAGIAGWLGGFFGLLNPFGLLCGLVSVAMTLGHGAVYLLNKTDGKVYERAQQWAKGSIILWVVLFAVGGIWVAHIDSFQLNEVTKQVSRVAGAWRHNFQTCPVLWIIPVLGFLSAFLALGKIAKGATQSALFFTGLMVSCTVATAGVSLFPFLMPSSFNIQHSLTLWNSSSSHFTLWLMTLATVIFLPIVLAYTTWVYRILRGKITEKTIADNSDKLY